ncbi:hypothetical protein [uncultured Alsobacter sp.]|uniref:hypothetical protein n=1 Tax=uncultured Alsobacter sp. TaxID=1748258 RepID=UPI0025F9F99C|nr:hypothetical protein [uncultured Alsobacter sp.]
MTHQQIRNDGTDPRKNDGTGKDVQATTRSCFIYITNSLAADLTEVVLTHQQGNNIDTIECAQLKSGSESPSKQISFETGFWANFDYWNISFRLNNVRYNTPYNDRCNLEASDAGSLVSCNIATRGDDIYLSVGMASGGCLFIIEKVG